MDAQTVRELTPETWPDFVALVERSGGMFSGCWCSWFHQGVPDDRREGESSRDFKERMVRAGVAHAALVYLGDEAVAWAEYGTPEELPGIHHRKQYDAESTARPDYRITCVYVDKRRRRAGLGTAALHGALDLIANAGGGLVEGYPQDLTGRDPAKRMNPSFLYNLTRRTYEDAGFTYLRPKGKNHCVMARQVAARG